MRSAFIGAPFSRFDLGAHALRSSSRGLSQSTFASPQTVFGAFDFLSKAGLSSEDIDKIADPKIRAEIKAEFERCQSKESVESLGCLVALGLRVKDILDEEVNAPPASPIRQPAPTSTFPIVPVAIAGVAALGLVYYLATKKG